MTDFRATPEQWETMKDSAADNFDDGYAACILELCARVEALECKYETQRLATLEWGKDVDKVKRWNDQHLRRIEALETNSKPAPNPSRIGSSLVERVAAVLADEDAPVDLWHEDARAAIGEVAAWFGDKATPGTPQWIAAADLTEEVER